MPEEKVLVCPLHRADGLEELFHRVANRVMKKLYLLPPEVRNIGVPLKIVEECLVEEGIPKNIVPCYTRAFREEGFIKLKTKGATTKDSLQLAEFNREKVPKEIPLEVLEKRVALFYEALEAHIGKKVTPGVSIPSEARDGKTVSDIYEEMFKKLYYSAIHGDSSSSECENDEEFRNLDLYSRTWDILRAFVIIVAFYYECCDEQVYYTYGDCIGIGETVVTLSKEEAIRRIRDYYKEHGPIKFLDVLIAETIWEKDKVIEESEE